jgi:GNAT superfamily N-acetyltransferase
MVTVREAVSDEDLAAWREVRRRLLPDERSATVAELRALERPGRLLVLAEITDESGRTVVAGTGVTDRSDIAGRAFIAPRVLPEYRRRGIGTALLRVLAQRARANGFTVASGGVDDEPAGVPFARHFGLAEVDRQVEQVLDVGTAPAPIDPPAGTRIVTVADQPDIWARAYNDVAVEAVKDMAFEGSLQVSAAEWEGVDWITTPAAAFVAVADDGSAIGVASLMLDPDRPDRAEQGLTAVRRDWRHRGVAVALKRATFGYAKGVGLREIFTWTQQNNGDMRRLNEYLGFRYGHVSITMMGPVPTVE